jgi:hypothetical protein
MPISVEVMMATTGVSLGHFDVESGTAHELTSMVEASQPPRCCCVFLRGVVRLEPDSVLEQGEQLSVTMEHRYVGIELAVKYQGQTWLITTPLDVDLEYPSDVSVADVLARYRKMPGSFGGARGDDNPSEILMGLFRDMMPEVVWEVREETHHKITDPLNLRDDAVLVIVPPSIPGPPVFLFVARSDEDLDALGVDELLETGDVEDGDEGYHSWVVELWNFTPDPFLR